MNNLEKIGLDQMIREVRILISKNLYRHAKVSINGEIINVGWQMDVLRKIALEEFNDDLEKFEEYWKSNGYELYVCMKAYNSRIKKGTMYLINERNVLQIESCGIMIFYSPRYFWRCEDPTDVPGWGHRPFEDFNDYCTYENKLLLPLLR